MILPDHFHAVWTLPPGDADFSTRMRLIKTSFSRSIPQTERLSPRRAAKAERGIWQRRFWEHVIRDEQGWRRHVHYVHYNRSSMDMSAMYGIDRIRHFIGMLRQVSIRPTGVPFQGLNVIVWRDAIGGLRCANPPYFTTSQTQEGRATERRPA